MPVCLALVEAEPEAEGVHDEDAAEHESFEVDGVEDAAVQLRAAEAGAADSAGGSIAEGEAAALAEGAPGGHEMDDPAVVEAALPWLSLPVPQGKVTWYRAGSMMEARCKGRGHGRCALTRKTYVVGKSTGRPVGLLIAWLQDTTAATREEHMALADQLAEPADRAQRRAARVAYQGNPDAQRLFLKERAVWDGEDIEA